MKKNKNLFIFMVLIVFTIIICPTKIFAQELNLKIGSWWNEKDMYTAGYDVNIYYSFFNKGIVTLNIDGNKASMTLDEDEFYHEEKHFYTPKIEFNGTYEKSGNSNIIELTGTVDGTIINEYTTRTNYYYYTLSKITLKLEYFDSKIKDGVVEVSASGRSFGSSVHKNGDNPEQYEDYDDYPIYTMKEFEISGLNGNSDKEVVATSKDTNNSNNNSSSETTSSSMPYIIVGATIIVIGGIAYKRFISSNGKTYELNTKTGDYENGDTILNTSNIEEVEKQKQKDEEWIHNERNKIKNKDTLQDKENTKMLDEEHKKEKEVERENYIDRVASRNGINSSDNETIKKELSKKQKQKEEQSKKANKTVEHIDNVITTAEAIEEASDYAIAAGEAFIPGGKVVSASYKVIKNVGKTAVDSTKTAGDVVESIITSSADAANVFVDSKIIKAGSTIGSNVVGKATSAVINGENVIDSMDEGFDTGTAGAIVNALGDEIGSKLGGTAGQMIGNVSSNVYQKRVVDPKLEKKLKEKKNNKKKKK